MGERKSWVRPVRKSEETKNQSLVRVIVELVPVALLAAVLVASISIGTWLAPTGVSLAEAVDFEDLYFFLIQNLPAASPLLAFATLGFVARLKRRPWLNLAYRVCLVVSVIVWSFTALAMLAQVTSKDMAHGSWSESGFRLWFDHVSALQSFVSVELIAKLVDMFEGFDLVAIWVSLLATGVVLGWQIRRLFELRHPRDQPLRYRQLVVVAAIGSISLGSAFASNFEDRFGVGEFSVGYGAYKIDLPRSSLSVIGGGNLPGACGCGSVVEWVGRRSIVLNCSGSRAILYSPQNVSIQSSRDIDRIAAKYEEPEHPAFIHWYYWVFKLNAESLSLADLCRDDRAPLTPPEVESPLVLTRLGWRIDVSKINPRFDYNLNCADGRIFVTGKNLSLSSLVRDKNWILLGFNTDGPDKYIALDTLTFRPDIALPASVDGEPREAAFGEVNFDPAPTTSDRPATEGPFHFWMQEESFGDAIKYVEFDLKSEQLERIDNTACAMILGAYLLPFYKPAADKTYLNRMLRNGPSRYRSQEQMRAEVVTWLKTADAATKSRPDAELPAHPVSQGSAEDARRTVNRNLPGADEPKQ